MTKRSMVIIPGILILMSGAVIGDMVEIPADKPSWTDTGIDVRGLTGFGFSVTGLACYTYEYCWDASDPSQ